MADNTPKVKGNGHKLRASLLELLSHCEKLTIRSAATIEHIERSPAGLSQGDTEAATRARSDSCTRYARLGQAADVRLSFNILQMAPSLQAEAAHPRPARSVRTVSAHSSVDFDDAPCCAQVDSDKIQVLSCVDLDAPHTDRHPDRDARRRPALEQDIFCS